MGYRVLPRTGLAVIPDVADQNFVGLCRKSCVPAVVFVSAKLLHLPIVGPPSLSPNRVPCLRPAVAQYKDVLPILLIPVVRQRRTATLIDHRVVYFHSDLLEMNRLPHRCACLATVLRRVSHNPNDYPARLEQPFQVPRHSVKVPRVPAVGAQVVVWRARHHKVNGLARHLPHYFAVVAADDLIQRERTTRWSRHRPGVGWHMSVLSEDAAHLRCYRDKS